MEKNKTTETNAVKSVVEQLEASIQNLPRTDFMTLPAVMVTSIDEETLERMKAISEINAATDKDTKIGSTGKTFGEIVNEFKFGVASLEEIGEKHSFKATATGVVISAPEINGERAVDVVIEATPANISPSDAGAPTNPVDAKEEGNVSPAIPVFNNTGVLGTSSVTPAPSTLSTPITVSVEGKPTNK